MASILIVGSGVAGTILARQLLASDERHEVTILEAGPGLEPTTYRRWLDYLMAGESPYDGFWEPPREEHERFGLRGSRLFVKGGTTNHWGGWSLRFKPEDFELHARTGFGADWPITYDELAPHYALAETLLGIEGDSDNDDPPRYGARFPFEAAPYTLNDMPVIGALDSLGMSYSHLPMARNGSRCITTGTCRVCPVNARYTATFDLVDLQRTYPERLELRTAAPAITIAMDGKRAARGVRFLDRASGETDLLEAERVAICCGTVESTKLLLASANADWTEGIGNDSGHVGRHLIGHPLIYVEGIRPGNPERAAQELDFITLGSRHYDTPAHQREGKMLFVRAGGGSLAAIEQGILRNASRAEIERTMSSGIYLALEASVEQFESPENRVRLGGETAQPGLRATRLDFGVNAVTAAALQTHRENLLEVMRAAGCDANSIRAEFIKPDGAHATSTCRMSASDSDGVVDRDLRVHGVENLFVCSNAVFPNVTAVNPTLTVAALAVRLAETISRAA